MYLPSHGVAGLLNLAAATIPALGLLAASLAAPRWIRSAVTRHRRRLVLFGTEPDRDAGPSAPAGRMAPS